MTLVPGWHVDADVTAHALETLLADKRFTFEPLKLPDGVSWNDITSADGGLRPKGRRQIVDLGRQQNADAVLVIEPSARNGRNPTASPGVGLYERRLVGNPHVEICVSIALVVIRVPPNDRLDGALQSMRFSRGRP